MKWHLTPTISQKTDSGKAGLKKFHIKKDGASLRLSYNRATVIQANIIQGSKNLSTDIVMVDLQAKICWGSQKNYRSC